MEISELASLVKISLKEPGMGKFSSQLIPMTSH